jgi:hypothetical protein
MVPAIMIYYWFLFGFCVMYFFFKPTYTPLVAFNDNVNLGLGALYMLFEALNFRCHMITAGLRRPGTNERGIP